MAPGGRLDCFREGSWAACRNKQSRSSRVSSPLCSETSLARTGNKDETRENALRKKGGTRSLTSPDRIAEKKREDEPDRNKTVTGPVGAA